MSSSDEDEKDHDSRDDSEDPSEDDEQDQDDASQSDENEDESDDNQDESKSKDKDQDSNDDGSEENSNNSDLDPSEPSSIEESKNDSDNPSADKTETLEDLTQSVDNGMRGSQAEAPPTASPAEIIEERKRQERVDEKQLLLHRLMNNDSDDDIDQIAHNEQLLKSKNTRRLAAAMLSESDDDDIEGEEDGEDKLIVLGQDEPHEESKHSIQHAEKDEGEKDQEDQEDKKEPTTAAVIQNEQKSESEHSSFEDGDVFRKQNDVKAENDLSYTQMISKVTKAHPHIVVNGKRQQYPICKTRTGYNCRTPACRDTDLKSLGPGVTIYFKFVKYLVVIFTIMSIISLPSMVLFISAGTEDYEDGGGITGFFSITTLGNLGSAYKMCDFGENFSSTINLYCTSGTIDSIYILGQGLSDGSSTCENDGDSLEVDSSCDYDTSFSESMQEEVDIALDEQCVGETICDFDLSSISFPSECTGVPYITINCKGDEIWGLKKGYLALGLVILDILAIFAFWICMMRHGSYEYLEEEEINGAVLDGSDFALVIKNLPKTENFQILKAKLWQHLEQLLYDNPDKYVKRAHDPNAFFIADINFGMSDYGIMNFYIERTSLIKQQVIIEVKLDILKDSIQPENKKEKIKKQLDKRWEKLEKKKLKNETNYQKFLEKNKQKVVKAFVTFKSMEGKLRTFSLYNHSWMSKLCRRKALKPLYFEGKYLDVRHPTTPSLILWENLGVTQKERFFRILVVGFISLILLILTAIIIIYSRSYQTSLSDEYGDSNCPADTIDIEDAYNDHLKDKNERSGLMHCYCKQEYKDKNFDVADIVFENGKKYCEDWLFDYSISIFLVWLMVMVISMINVMLKVAMRLISAYERRHDKTDLVISNTFKMFVVQFVNTGILILIINAQLDGVPGWFPILNGKYDDFTSEWYKQIGVSIILTMMIGIISPHIANGMFHLRFFCKRCCDRKCSCDKKRTKQLYQGDYENLYMGPELLFEYRYSTMLNSIFITLMYGTGMPILYIFAAFSFLLTYWVDKVTVLRIYQTPPRYDISLQKTTREWTNLAIILHLVFGFWMYSNSIIFDTENEEVFGVNITDDAKKEASDQGFGELGERIGQWHTLIYFAFILFFILIFLFRVLLLGSCKRACKRCQRNREKFAKSTLKAGSVFCTNYFENLDPHDAQSNSQKVYDDIKKYKRIKRELAKDGNEHDIEKLDWLIERFRQKRQDIIDGYKAPKQKIGREDILIIDSSYDIRDIKPYCFYVSKMEKDLKDNKKAIQKSQETLKKLSTLRRESSAPDPESGKVNDESKEDNKIEEAPHKDENEPVDHESIVLVQKQAKSTSQQDEDIEESSNTDRGINKVDEKNKILATGPPDSESKSRDKNESQSKNADDEESSVVSSVKYSNYDYSNE